MADDEGTQQSMFDLSGREFNAMWVDEKQPLFVANNPKHWKAHKIQVAINRLEKHLERNPAQFNASVYKSLVDDSADLMEQINAEILDKRGVAQIGNTGAAAQNSDVEPISLDP